jgi:hypothetical protein
LIDQKFDKIIDSQIAMLKRKKIPPDTDFILSEGIVIAAKYKTHSKDAVCGNAL